MHSTATSRRAVCSLFTLLLVSLLSGLSPVRQAAAAPARAAATTDGRDPSAVIKQAFVAAEDLRLVQILTSLRLTPAQTRQLLPVLDGAQAKLRKQMETERQALARYRSSLEKTRASLLAGKPVSSRTEGLFSKALETETRKLQQLQSDLVNSLRRSTERILTREQFAQLAGTNRMAHMKWRKQKQYFQAVQGEVASGGHVGVIRQLDGMRRSSAEQYPQARFKLALRLAGLHEQDAAQRERGGPGFSPDDPNLQRQLAPQYALLDRLRQMPEEEFKQQRDEVALQNWMQQLDLSQQDPEERQQAAAEREADIEALIERYFLSPRMVVVIRERLAGASARSTSGGER